MTAYATAHVVVTWLCLRGPFRQALAATVNDISDFTPVSNDPSLKSVTVNDAVSISFTGTSANRIACWASSSGNCGTECNNAGAFTSITTGSATFTIASTGAAYVLCLADDTADVTNSANVFEQSGLSLAVVTATGAIIYSGITPAGGIVGRTVTFTLTGTTGSVDEKVYLAEACNTVDLNTNSATLTANTVNPSFSQNLQGLSSGTSQDFKICVGKVTGSDEIAQGTVLSVRVETASAAGDPVAYFGRDRKVNFWLPLGMFMPLLRTSDLDIWGRTGPGPVGEHGQLFDRFVVASRGGLMVDIGIRKTSDVLTLSDDVNRVPSTEVALHPTQNVTDLEALDVSYIEGQSRGSVGLDDGWVQVQGLKRQDASSLERSVLPHEAVEVLSDSAHFSVCLGYTIDYATTGEKSFLYDYSHLSLQMIRMPDFANYSGVFPELWGLQAPSECTSRLMVLKGMPDEDLPSECFKFEAYEQNLGKGDDVAAAQAHFSLEL